MYYKKEILLLLLIKISVCYARADTIPYLFKGFQTHYGFIIPHSAAIEAVSYTNPYGFEVSLNRLNTSYRSWKVYNAYSVSGIQAGYFNFQNPEILGGSFVLTGFTEPVISYGEKLIFSVRGGAGFSYHTKIYDHNENPLNQFFSTRINFPLYLSARIKVMLSRKTSLTLSGCYNHISNGGFKQPNFGMNFPTIAVGVEHSQQPLPDLSKNFSYNPKVKREGIYLIIQALSGFKILDKTEVYPEKALFAFGLHSRVTKQLRTYYALNAGAELIVDGSIKETIRRDTLDIDHKRFALTAGQDFLLGKVIFTQYLGFYLYSPFKAKNRVYQKYELAYKIHPGILLGIYLKAHTQTAELMGFNLSCLLFNK